MATADLYSPQAARRLALEDALQRRASAKCQQLKCSRARDLASLSSSRLGCCARSRSSALCLAALESWGYGGHFCPYRALYNSSRAFPAHSFFVSEAFLIV